MGSAASKSTRTLPKRAGNVASSIPSHAKPKVAEMRASESKNSDIQRDAVDPQFLANLNRLGPVKVDHNMQTLQTSAQHKRMFDAQLQSEHEASSAAGQFRNRVLSVTLSDLLERRKYAKSTQELDSMLVGTGLDRTALERVARYVSTPSTKEGATFKTVGPDGEETIHSTATWLEPRVSL